MATDYMSGTRISDHDLTLSILGDVESVRSRLVQGALHEKSHLAQM